ncbi:hypothetical protein HRR80_003734 [Exophiala dermatitidis]|nr:hypothetical protein HRR73_002241 [Exophiala dermatitidis]KAJ4536828.1 hypothetical protein HRR76_004854 [Exophiala dermatitidis]KAJ4572113.1 hypothetical protein HRR79_003318 [Exophiala dermatitidis]KAJ4604321.1 hypothetical protein HRR84_001400 [Exophiala dermatitidis]KAJ4618938.1 hypothetical protein HRR85_001933 [Exophiala dermatitidis]
MQMGLHRDPKHFKRMSVLLWATILELDVQAALDAGVPPTIGVDDSDTEAPSNVNDVDLMSKQGYSMSIPQQRQPTHPSSASRSNHSARGWKSPVP